MSKKFLFICFLLGMFMFVPAGAHAASDDGSPATTITGDVNGDGVLDVTDVMVLANYISNPTAQTLNKDVADVNGDGTVNSSDIDALINKVLGIVTKYYWYVGQTNPSTMSEISPMASGTESGGGWYSLGTTLPDQITTLIKGGTSGNIWYVAVPSTSSLVPVGTDMSTRDTSVTTGSTVKIGDTTYQIYIYEGITATRNTFRLAKK